MITVTVILNLHFSSKYCMWVCNFLGYLIEVKKIGDKSHNSLATTKNFTFSQTTQESMAR